MRPWTMLAAALFCLPACPLIAADLADGVPGHPGLTYQTLLKRIIPDLAPEGANGLTGHIGVPFRHIEGRQAETDLPEQFSLYSLTVMRVPGDTGKIVLFADLGPSRDIVSAFALLALFALRPEVTLLDTVGVGADRFVSMRDGPPPMLAPGAPLIVIDSTHHNSHQSYGSTALIFPRANRFTLLATISTLGESNCRERRVHEALVSTLPDAGPYRAVLATVRETVTQPGPDCGNPRKPRSGITAHRALYRWDARRERFVTASRALERLAARNATRY